MDPHDGLNPHGLNPHDPATILRDLPESEREFFVAQYRRVWLEAVNPAGFAELWRFLTMWRLHAGPVPGAGHVPSAIRRWELRRRRRLVVARLSGPP